MNLVKNSGFETDRDGDGVPDNWSFQNRGGSPIFKLEEEACEGKRSVSIEEEGKDDDGRVVQDIPTKVNTDYFLKFSYKTANVTGGPPEVMFWADDYFSPSLEWTTGIRTRNSGAHTNLALQLILFHSSVNSFISKSL